MTRMAWHCIVAVSLVGTATANDATTEAQDEGVAVVSIDLLTPDVVRGQCADGSCNSGSCPNGNCPGHGGCPDCNGKKKGLKARLKSKFGYFCPTGNCGRGMPLWGKYHMVYAAQPGYTDARDGYSFAAPGYGTPVNVPLAPNVRHTYNYGWGIPSSRLTPLRQAQVVGPAEPAVHHGPIWRY